MARTRRLIQSLRNLSHIRLPLTACKRAVLDPFAGCSPIAEEKINGADRSAVRG